MHPPTIKTIIPTSRDCYAAFLPDKENKIGPRVERIVCWSLIERDKKDETDEVIGQIIEGNVITEVTSVDEEEGFGEFLGYFDSESTATTAIMEKAAEDEGEDDEEEDADEDDEEEEEEEDEDEDDEDDEDGDDEDDEDEEDEDEDEEDEDDDDEKGDE